MLTKKQRFLQEIDEHYEKAMEFCVKKPKMIVSIQMPDLPSIEEIVNPFENYKGKKEYYDKAYNDDLELIAFPKIKIVAWNFE
jgi:hypothetical protein